MSLLDDVSIVVTPNGYKAGTLYGVIPSNGDADMDVTRNTAATRVDEDGLIEDVLSNVPRIDYTGGGCPHILSEPERTNLVEDSEDFSDSFWSRYIATIDPNDTTAPDATTTADKITTSGVYGNINHTFSKAASAITYTQSVFIKRSGYTLVNFIAYGEDSSDRAQVGFDLSDGTIDSAASVSGNFTNASAAITSYTNDWYRITLTYTTGATQTSGGGDTQIRTYIQFPAAMSTNYVWLWGAQLEVGAYPTSYIPTSGSTVTRNQDVFTRDGIGSLINSPEGVLFVEIAALSNDSTIRTISLSDGTNTNRVILRYDNASNIVQGFIQVGGATNGDINDNSYTITNFLKIAYKWKAGDFALWINGTEVATSADATSFGAGVLTEMQFNEGDGAGGEYYGKVKQLQVYKTALEDDQLDDLTS